MKEKDKLNLFFIVGYERPAAPLPQRTAQPTSASVGFTFSLAIPFDLLKKRLIHNKITFFNLL